MKEADTLLQLELDLYKGQAEVLAKRVCELELRQSGNVVQASNLHSGTQATGKSYIPEHTQHRPKPNCASIDDEQCRETLQAELDRARHKIDELRAEVDLLRAAALDPDGIPPYVRNLCRELAAEREERERCLRIVRDFTQATPDQDSMNAEEWSAEGMMDRSGSVEVTLQRRVASLCRAQRRLRGENADLARRLRAAARDASDAAAAAEDLRRQLELAHEWNALGRRSGDAHAPASRRAGERRTASEQHSRQDAGGPAAPAQRDAEDASGIADAHELWEVGCARDPRSRRAASRA